MISPSAPEAYSLYGITIAVITILALFIRSLSKRQDQMFGWFQSKMDNSLEALKEALAANKHATEHNTRNLKTIQELFASTIERALGYEKERDAKVIEKLDQILEAVSREEPPL